MKMLRDLCKVVQKNKTMIAVILLLVVIFNQVHLGGMKEPFVTGGKEVISETTKKYDLVFFSMDVVIARNLLQYGMIFHLVHQNLQI